MKTKSYITNPKWILVAIVTVLFLALVAVVFARRAEGSFVVLNGDGCTYNCPVIHFEWQTKACPNGYSHVSQQHPGYCYKGNSPDWPEDYKLMVVTNHAADVQYNKSQDPNKCHRPSDNDLEDDYGMDNDARHDFKDANSEWKDSIKVCPTPTCTPTPIPPTPTPQECKEGYELVEDECVPVPTPTPVVCEEGLQLVDNNCVPVPIPEPTKTPERKPLTDPSGPFLANTCTGQAGPVVAGSNFHVYRNGSTAEAKWTPGDGSEAQIYYKENKDTDYPYAWAGANTGSVVIDHLKPNVGYDFVLYTNNHCSNGLKAGEFVNDGPQSRLFKSLGVIAF